MKPTPERLDMIIKMAKRCASPLPWEVDINRANEKIFELWTALEASNKLLWEAFEWGINNPFLSALHENIEIRSSENDQLLYETKEVPECSGQD